MDSVKEGIGKKYLRKCIKRVWQFAFGEQRLEDILTSSRNLFYRQFDTPQSSCNVFNCHQIFVIIGKLFYILPALTEFFLSYHSVLF